MYTGDAKPVEPDLIWQMAGDKADDQAIAFMITFINSILENEVSGLTRGYETEITDRSNTATWQVFHREIMRMFADAGWRVRYEEESKPAKYYVSMPQV